MNDVNDNDLHDVEAEISSAPIGEQLKSARENCKLSVEEVAQELHLDAEVVEALENGARNKLPAQIFVQGYLKSYARLVGLPADELLRQFNEQAGEPPPLSVTSASATLPSVRLRSLRLVRNTLLLLLAAAMLWLVWPLAERIIDSQRSAEMEQAPGRLELPPVNEFGSNGS